MKKFFLLIAVLSLTIAVNFGCSGTKAVKKPLEAKSTIYILTHHGNPDEMTESNYEARVITDEWMRDDLVKILNKNNYAAVIINNRDEYIQGPKNYLLEITMLSHHRINRAVRMWVGRMAGADTLTNRYVFSGENGETLFDYEDGIGSTKSSGHVARKLNANVVKKIKEVLN